MLTTADAIVVTVCAYGIGVLTAWTFTDIRRHRRLRRTLRLTLATQVPARSQTSAKR